MSNPTVPTTALNLHSDSFVPPHAEAHDYEHGGDPVIPQIRYLGQVTISARSLNTTATFADVAGSAITVRTRGGLIRLTYSGELDFLAQNTAPDDISTITVGGYIQATSTPANGSLSSLGTRSFAGVVTLTVPSADTMNTLFVANSANIVWYATLAAGEYTFKLQIRNREASTATSLRHAVAAQDPFTAASEPAFFTIEEILPIRRA